MMPSIGLLSYGLAATGFLFLTLLLATAWEGRGQGVRLIAACAVTTLWAALFALGAGHISLSPSTVVLAELLRYGAWFVVLTGLTRPAGIALGLARVVHGLWMAATLLLLFAPLLYAAGVVLPSPMTLLTVVGLTMSLLGLVLLEQVYRNSRESGHFALKFLVIALGAMFVYDLYLYSQSQLIKGVDLASWDARGFVILLMVPLLAIAARRNPQWSLNVFVSRHVVFYTTSFVAVGGYLLLMALGGYLIRLYGGTWGRAVQLVFLAGAAITLLALIASGALRRRLRVFLNKHFYRNKYDYRVEWLRFIQTLSEPEAGVETRDNTVRAIAQIIDSPGGVLLLKNDEGEYKASAAWPRGDFTEMRLFPVLTQTEPLVAFMARTQWVVDLEELRDAPERYGKLELPAFLRGDEHRFRLVVPLVHLDTLVGLALLAKTAGPFSPNYEDRDLLKTVGRHVAVHLIQIDADRQLAENRQFEAYHRLTAFVMHDLKNLAAQLALIVSNAEKHRRNPEFVDDAISTIANSTERMQRLIDQLQRREMQGQTRRLRLAEVARNAAERCGAREPAPVCTELDPGAWVEADAERLTMIVEHVIRNAQDATAEQGRVSVHVGIEGGGTGGQDAGRDTVRLQVPTAALSVTDTGIGMSREFIRERLFKPFDTTKGSKGMGIGAYQVREYIQSLGGRVEVVSETGQGTRMTLRLPLALPPDDLPKT